MKVPYGPFGAPFGLIEVDDIFTIAGINKAIPNPERRWWQFWKPRMIDSGKPMTFGIKEIR